MRLGPLQDSGLGFLKQEPSIPEEKAEDFPAVAWDPHNLLDSGDSGTQGGPGPAPQFPHAAWPLVQCQHPDVVQMQSALFQGLDRSIPDGTHCALGHPAPCHPPSGICL